VSYQVFARKYRPQTFADVLGQDHVVRTLRNAIAQNRLAHAYLFVGPRGTGKTSTARIFAKALNCPGGPSIEFDPNDPVCKEIAEGNSLDVLEIDGASNNGVDQVRDLRETVKYAPAKGRYKIYYIDEVHMLSTAAFNALLKTLEEPPPHVKFIFATTEANKILPTIISRCQRFDLRRISDPVIAKHLLHIAELEKVNLSEKAAYAIAKGADGGMRDAQSMLDQLVAFCGTDIEETDVLDMFGFTPQEAVSGLAQHILARDTVGALRFVHQQSDAGKDLGRLLADMIQQFRTLLVYQSDADAAVENLSPEMAEQVAAQANAATTEQLLRIVDGLAELDARMRWASNKRLHFELGVIQAVESMAEVSLSEVIEAIDKAGGGAAEAGQVLQARRAVVPIAPPVSVPKAVPPPKPRDVVAEEPPAPIARPVVQPEPEIVHPVAKVEPTPAPVAEPEPEPLLMPQPVVEAAKEPVVVPDDLWAAIQPLVQAKRPLIGTWVQMGTQMAYANGKLKVGFPTAEVHSRDSLLRDTTRKFLEQLLEEVAGTPVKLEMVVDASLKVPEVQSFFLGLSEPEPEPVKAPVATAKAEPAPEASALEESKEDFYDDPLIKAAVEIFKAKVVKA
jgi:DNA polymerase-3 subunit gamma/tau